VELIAEERSGSSFLAPRRTGSLRNGQRRSRVSEATAAAPAGGASPCNGASRSSSRASIASGGGSSGCSGGGHGATPVSPALEAQPSGHDFVLNAGTPTAAAGTPACEKALGNVQPATSNEGRTAEALAAAAPASSAAGEAGSPDGQPHAVGVGASGAAAAAANASTTAIPNLAPVRTQPPADPDTPRRPRAVRQASGALASPPLAAGGALTAADFDGDLCSPMWRRHGALPPGECGGAGASRPEVGSTGGSRGGDGLTCFTVHRCSAPLEPSPWVVSPVVRLHLVSAATGEYLRLAAPAAPAPPGGAVRDGCGEGSPGTGGGIGGGGGGGGGAAAKGLALDAEAQAQVSKKLALDEQQQEWRCDGRSSGRRTRIPAAAYLGSRGAACKAGSHPTALTLPPLASVTALSDDGARLVAPMPRYWSTPGARRWRRQATTPPPPRRPFSLTCRHCKPAPAISWRRPPRRHHRRRRRSAALRIAPAVRPVAAAARARRRPPRLCGTRISNWMWTPKSWPKGTPCCW
jgi:hypothetical protein